MDSLLKLLRENAALSTEDLAGMLSLSEDEIRAKIRQAQADGDILGYQAILSDDATGTDGVQAVIEVNLTPERDGGFNRLANRIAKYDEVSSCYLMSGSYDILVIVDGANLRQVASFVSEKLTTIQGSHLNGNAFPAQALQGKRGNAGRRRGSRAAGSHPLRP